MADPKPDFIRRENLVGKYDPESVKNKFDILPEEVRRDLDNALNRVGLSSEQCLAQSYLNELSEEHRKALSSFNGDLLLKVNTGASTKNTIQFIVNILKSLN